MPTKPKSELKQFNGYVDYLMNAGKPGYPSFYKVGQQPEKKRSNETESLIFPGKKRSIGLEFDGEKLTTTVKENGNVSKYSYDAVAGAKENGKFNYSKERQKVPEKGPIPEKDSTYWINPQEIQYISNRAKRLGSFGFGNFPGGTDSWGNSRVWINPQNPDGDEIKRGKFSIHGGEAPGSRGCIDLTNNNDEFMHRLKSLRGTMDSIPLKVNYDRVNKKNNN